MNSCIIACTCMCMYVMACVVCAGDPPARANSNAYPAFNRSLSHPHPHSSIYTRWVLHSIVHMDIFPLLCALALQLCWTRVSLEIVLKHEIRTTLYTEVHMFGCRVSYLVRGPRGCLYVFCYASTLSELFRDSRSIYLCVCVCVCVCACVHIYLYTCHIYMHIHLYFHISCLCICIGIFLCIECCIKILSIHA